MGKKRKNLDKKEQEAVESSKKFKKESVEPPPSTLKEKFLSSKLGNNFKRNTLYSDSSESDSSDSDSDDTDTVKLSSAVKIEPDSSSSDSWSSSDSEKPTTKGNEKERESELDMATTKSDTGLEHPKPIYPAAQMSSSDSYHSDTEEEDKKRKKKQKQQLQIELNKKAKKGVFMKKPEIKEKITDEGQSDEEATDNIPCNNDVSDLPEWPQNDYAELIRRMEAQLPQKDNQKFDSRALKLDWNKIAFSKYSAEECLDVWSGISKRVRRFRILSEILQDAKEWVTRPWTNFYRGSKKNRHPDMPSRPLSTYMIYYLEHKDKVARKNPGMDMTQVSKIISEKYKNLSPSERERYTELAAKERKAFETKLSDFYKEHPDLVKSPKKSQTKENLSKGPRKPNNPFKLYLEHQLKKRENVDKKVVEEETKEKWKGLSDKKKAVYINASLEDLKRFEEEVKEYRAEHPDYAPPPLKSVLSKEEKLIKEKLAGKPLKPPNSAYSLFSRKMLQSDPDVKSLPPKERMAEISKKWKQLTDSQKLNYEEEVRQMQDSYKLEFASYLEGLPEEDRQIELNTPKKLTGKKKERATASPKKNRNGEKKNKTEKKNTNSQGTRPAPGNSKKHILTLIGENLARNKDLVLKEDEGLQLFNGEPKPPPVKSFDIFLQSFQPQKSHSDKGKLKEARRAWEKMTEEERNSYQKQLEELKKKYVIDFEVFLKNLSPDLLKEFSRFKENFKTKKKRSVNGNTEFLNEDSEEESSSSDSDSSVSTVLSNKSSSSSEDSDS